MFANLCDTLSKVTRRNASALLLVDEKWPKDMKSCGELSHRPINMTITTVKFDERVACRDYLEKIGSRFI